MSIRNPCRWNSVANRQCLGPSSQVILVLKAVPKEVLERYGAPGDDSGCLATKAYPASGD